MEIRLETAHPAEFSSIGSILEFGNNRVIVVDEIERLVFVVDFSNRTATRVGREGQGPGEYIAPLRLFRLQADTMLIFDAALQKLLLILPNLRVQPYLSLAEMPISGGVRARNPRAVDDRGQFYELGATTSLRLGVVTLADSAPIERWTAGSDRRDTIAFVRPTKRATGGTVEQEHEGVEIPFGVSDQWAVHNSGLLAILRSPNYRVEFRNSADRLRVAMSVPHTTIRLTQRHRDAWLQQQQESRTRGSMAGGGFVRSRGRTRTVVWPEYVPPFQAEAARFDAEGRLWVLRTRLPEEKAIYDVVDSRSQRTTQVDLPQNARIVGFGKDFIYVARYKDDLAHLERHRLVK